MEAEEEGTAMEDKNEGRCDDVIVCWFSLLSFR